MLGAALILAGMLLGGRAALLLAGRGRPQRGPRPAFIIAGVYRRFRNPLLAGVLLVGAGALCVHPSRAGIVTLVLGALALHTYLVLVEEPRLRARFGDVFVAYCDAVPRWLPRRRSRSRGER